MGKYAAHEDAARDSKRADALRGERLRIAELLLKGDPENPLRIRNLVDAKLTLSSEQQRQGNFAASRIEVDAALPLADALCVRSPDRIDFAEQRLSIYYHAFCDAWDLGDQEGARKYFDNAEHDLRRAVKLNPSRSDLQWMSGWLDFAHRTFGVPL